MNGTVETQYLSLVDVTPEDRKTRIVEVRNRSHGYVLGEIRWHGGWRQYVFLPEADCLFSSGCLWDIQAHIGRLMSERKRVHGEAVLR